jgi:Fe2+ or Zn2+ uptake regulation protein
MTDNEVRERLMSAGIKPTAQRIAIASFVFVRGEHPTANEVIEGIQDILPMVSRATVYNSLNALVKAGLVMEVQSGVDDLVRYDGNVEPHHHLVDSKTGRLFDVPFEEVEIANLEDLKQKYNLRRITVTMNGDAQ